MLCNAQEPTRVLFIGNSYTDVNNLPLLVKNVALSAGRTIEYRSNTPGGCTFEMHCQNESMRLIQEGGWDFVVLQEQSQLPSFPQSQVEVECLPFAAQLAQAVYQYNPDGEAMFYMTWGRRNGDERNAQYFPVLGTYEGMDSMLYERYMYMARTNDASVCPVGRVWRYIRNNHSDIELYQSDDSHPSEAGSYAAACAFYTMIFRNTPDSITFNSSLSESTAATIRNAVRSVVFDNLEFWLRQPADTTGGDTTHVDTTTTDTTHIDTTQVGLRNIAAPHLYVAPNPVVSSVTVAANGTTEPMTVTLCDIRGRRLQQHALAAGNNPDQQSEFLTLDLSAYSSGIYLITLSTPTSSTTRKILKQ